MTDDELTEVRNAIQAQLSLQPRVDCRVRPQPRGSHPRDCICGGSGTVESPLVVQVREAETEACGGSPLEGIGACRLKQRDYSPDVAAFMTANPDWEKRCICKGTGRVLCTVTMGDPISEAEACGRLQLIAMLTDEGEDYGDTLDTGSPEWDAWYAFCRAAFGHDRLAAYEKLLTLLEALATEEVTK